MKEMKYDLAPQYIEGLMKMIFRSAESLVVNNTYQFEDYSKIVGTRFDPVEKQIISGFIVQVFRCFRFCVVIDDIIVDIM
jgi:hypothetical protein